MQFEKLIIMIPCYNESEQIGSCLRSLPSKVLGFSCVETLVVDDGSTDDTIDQARKAGATHVFVIGRHVGLAQAFSQGLDFAIMLNADAIVNFDADQQYFASEIPLLLEPILTSQADYVLGQRNVMSHPHFNLLKKGLQSLGSWFVSFLTGLTVFDATTGFRALTRETGLRLSIWTEFSYTLESLFQAADLGLRIKNVPIGVNPAAVRPSRLVRSNLHYCWQSFKTMLITTVRYRPFNTFLSLSGISFGMSFLIGLRFLWYSFHGHHGLIQSLILCAIMAVSGFSCFLISILAETESLNRRLLEQIRYDQRRRTLLESHR